MNIPALKGTAMARAPRDTTPADILPEPALRSLDQVLSLADNGDYLPELLADHTELIQALKDFANAYGAKATGSFTLKITYKTDQYGALDVAFTHEVKKPKRPGAKAIAWATADGAVTPNNPAQLRFGIRDAGEGRRELRTPAD